MSDFNEIKRQGYENIKSAKAGERALADFG